MFAFFQEWDASVLYWIQQNLRSDFMNFLMKGISFLGDHGIFMIVVTAILLIFPDDGLCIPDTLVCQGRGKVSSYISSCISADRFNI